MRLKTIMLGAAMIAALCVGVWFFVSPSLDKQADLEHQGELLESILAVMPIYAAIDSEIEPTVHEYESSVSDDNGYVAEPPLDVPDEPELLTFEPLSQEDFPSGIIPIGILTINSIDLCLPVMEGVSEPELKIALGRLSQSANVGEIGNAVIFGHRNYTYGSMFNRLGEVEIGNIIRFQAMCGELMTFEVFEILVVTPESRIAFIQPQNESIITLYTCTPVREATHRLVIRAIKIEGGL